ncbi:MAG: hypothetical protein L0220_04680 [Acidobacteria bacterium]|nr:hypothetical protein [Acidobacteriota bacterium]
MMLKPKFIHKLIALSLLLVLASPAKGQSPAPALISDGQSKERPAVKLDTNVVTFTVTVTDPYNRLVTGLELGHFEVFEDKVKQNIEYFNVDDAPVSVGIAFDVSGSMKGKIDRAREALKAFVDTSHNDDDFFLVAFNQRANLVAGADYPISKELLLDQSL